jgi:cell division protease FtsH
MTDELGPVIYDKGSFAYSEKTAERIDMVVQHILQDCLKDVKELLKNNRDKLELLAKALLQKETLEAEEIYDLLGIAPRATHKLA